MKKFFVSVFVALTTFLTISAQQNSLKPNLLVQEAKKINKSVPVQLFSISKTRNDVLIPKEIENYSILEIDQEGLRKFTKEIKQYDENMMEYIGPYSHPHPQLHGLWPQVGNNPSSPYTHNFSL